ncbi:farnesyl-diphosphate synthase [Enterococcus florum]|uniref:Farnesyl diphosphate synthase n=1 Tax=Enterococcus florum TaxID=2480627 RepID=A0A4P5PD85_9ENTE|nr:farnesyl diphosphate synthase [Enterococcus florum]GCF93978.1 farnesyl-diphosphate synthase [Enterococcus florum]
MLKEFASKELPKVEKEMCDFINAHTTNKDLKEAMLYSLQAGGKRIRPLIVLSTAYSFCGQLGVNAYQTAAALEMIHTYSLIHDDLPAMDDDDLRRGKPTNHKVFGEALAILAGDGLFTSAFQSMTQMIMEPEEKLLLIQLLTKAAGTEGMVAGQAGDMAAEKTQVSLEVLKRIHREKTGALLTYAFVAGGILAQQTEYVLDQLQQLGAHMGLAFQIRDDLLDVVGTTEDLGKKVGQDARQEKSTYPRLLGVEGAKQALVKELSAAKKIINQLMEVDDFDAALLEDLVRMFTL